MLYINVKVNGKKRAPFSDGNFGGIRHKTFSFKGKLVLELYDGENFHTSSYDSTDYEKLNKDIPPIQLEGIDGYFAILKKGYFTIAHAPHDKSALYKLWAAASERELRLFFF